jgi:hypothetical protein
MMEPKGERVMLRNEHGERESHKHAVGHLQRFLPWASSLAAFLGRRP